MCRECKLAVLETTSDHAPISYVDMYGLGEPSDDIQHVLKKIAVQLGKTQRVKAITAVAEKLSRVKPAAHSPTQAVLTHLNWPYRVWMNRISVRTLKTKIMQISVGMSSDLKIEHVESFSDAVSFRCDQSVCVQRLPTKTD
ncbi:UNVERIFIED_CONTAM: hypothetical protein FKN15_021270 [Acipenser sinensis]